MDRYEIIVVNDGSSDDTETIARDAGVNVITISPSGPAAARNHGAKAAQAEILLFTDADCIPTSTWIEEMIQSFSDPEVYGVKGVYLTAQKELTARFVQIEYENKYKRMNKFHSIDFIDTYSAGFRKAAFFDVGGYDESFPGASVEDQEFSFRMQQKGYRMVFNPNAIVYHSHVNNPWGYFRKKFKIGYWKVKVLKTHPGKIISDSHTPQSLKLQIPVVFIFLLSLVFSPLISIWPALAFLLFFLIFAWEEIMASGQKDSCRLAVTAVFLLVLRSVGLGSGLLTGVISSITWGK